MPPTAGTRLGPCEVVAPAGAGGVGEVYRVRDTLREETREAYEDMAAVARVVEGAGLARHVARLGPFVVVKG